MAQRAGKGSTVQVHYTGRLKDGTVFDSSRSSQLKAGSDPALSSRDPIDGPLEFVIGAGQVIPGFERAVIGMHVSQKKTVEIPPDQAYGEYIKEYVKVVPRWQLRLGVDLQPGMRLELRAESGREIQITITDMNDTTVTLDANHPLAGETLFFDIELVAMS